MLKTAQAQFISTKSLQALPEWPAHSPGLSNDFKNPDLTCAPVPSVCLPRKYPAKHRCPVRWRWSALLQLKGTKKEERLRYNQALWSVFSVTLWPPLTSHILLTTSLAKVGECVSQWLPSDLVSYLEPIGAVRWIISKQGISTRSYLQLWVHCLNIPQFHICIWITERWFPSPETPARRD